MNNHTKTSPIRIMLLEKDSQNVMAFRGALERSHVNARITHIAMSDFALRRLETDPASFDVMVVGRRLSDMTGLEFCRETVERRIELPVVFLTEKRQEGMVREMLKMGFVDEFIVQDPDGKYLEVLPLMLSEVARRYNDRIARERHQKAVQTLEHRFRTILAKNADGMIIVDGKGEVQLANAAAKSMLGRTGKELLGKPFPYAVEAGKRSEITITRKTGETAIAEMRVVEIEWKETTANLASLRDITYRKQMEQDLAETNQALTRTVEQLQQANRKIMSQQKELIQEERLKLLLQMAGATAHELNEPLMVMLGSIELIRMVRDDPEKLSNHLGRIEDAGKKITGIIKKIQTIQSDDPMPPLNPALILGSERKTRVLSVEDSDHDYEMLRSVLMNDRRISVSRASMIMEAEQMLMQDPFDLVLTEYMLPDGTAVDLIRHIAETGVIIPTVVITGQGDEVIASQVIQAGASDYIPKNRLDENSLIKTIAGAMEKGRLTREIKEANKKMAEMTSRDELTGLYNRRYFQGAISREFSRARMHRTDLVLCMMDLDHFKAINDTYGHAAGDLVLSNVGRMLRELTRQTDIVCRYGGEEFIIILPNTDASSARIMGERFRTRLGAHTFEYDAHKFQITASMGIAAYVDTDSNSPGELIDLADKALYEAKHAGRNRIVEFSAMMNQKQASA